MENYKCKCCGAPLQAKPMEFNSMLLILHCSYCGNDYEVQNNNIIKIETYQNPVEVLQYKIMVPREDYIRYGDFAQEMVINNAVRNLVDELIKNNLIDIYKEYDPITNNEIIKTRLRVVKGEI